jgi:hypothetical protein
MSESLEQSFEESNIVRGQLIAAGLDAELDAIVNRETMTLYEEKDDTGLRFVIAVEHVGDEYKIRARIRRPRGPSFARGVAFANVGEFLRDAAATVENLKRAGRDTIAAYPPMG